MIVIVGAGYAGAATAWSLARRGHGSRVILLEAEPTTGLYASGRNAGLIGALLEEDPPLVEMSVRGARLLAESFGVARCGSVRLLASEAEAEALQRRARDHDLEVQIAATAAVARDIPLIEGAPSPLAARCAADGKIDPEGLIRAYLAAAREAGVRLVTGARVTRLTFGCGRLNGVETSAGLFQGDWVVDAAGAWAGQLAASLGLGDLGLVPYRRHIFTSVPFSGIDASWPWVWDMPREVYFRVDGDRLSLCPCDADPHEPGAPEVTAAAEAQLAAKLTAAMPALASVRLERSRACLRTFAADRRYVVGPDPRLPGFFWVAGLGGTGATAGAAIGELAADLLLGGDATSGLARDFDPGRLISGPAGPAAA